MDLEENVTSASSTSSTWNEDHVVHQSRIAVIVFLTLDVLAIVFVVVTNTLVLILAKKMKKKQKVTFVVSLSVANLMAGVLGLPSAMMAHFSHIGLDGFCKTYQYFIHLTECAEVYSLVAIAVNRYRVVTAKKSSIAGTSTRFNKVIVSAIWVFSIVYGFASLFVHEHSKISVVSDGKVHTFDECAVIEDMVPVKIVLSIDCLVLFIIPFITIITCYTLLVRFLHRESRNNIVSADKHKKKVLRVVLFLVTIFVVFNLPLLALDMHVSFGPGYFKHEDLVHELFGLFAFLNFGLNAFVYALMSSNFKLGTGGSSICFCRNIQVHPASSDPLTANISSAQASAHPAAMSSTMVIPISSISSFPSERTKNNGFVNDIKMRNHQMTYHA